MRGGAIAVAASCMAMYWADGIIGYESWWVTVCICTVCTYAVAFRTDSYYEKERTVRRECLVNLQDGTIGEEFHPAEYPNYRKIRAGEEGNDYLSPAGIVVCTRFIEQKQLEKVKSNSFTAHTWCMMLIGLSFICWSAVMRSGHAMDMMQMHMEHIQNNILDVKSKCGVYYSYFLKEKILDVVRDVQDMGGTMKENIMQFLNRACNQF